MGIRFFRILILLLCVHSCRDHSVSEEYLGNYIDAITYGQNILAPLVSGTSFKLYDWDNDGLTDILIHQDYHNTGSPPRLIWSRNVGNATNPIFTSIDQCPVLIESSDLGYFVINDFNGDNVPELITAGSKGRNLIVFKNIGTDKQPEWEKYNALDENGNSFIALIDSREGGPPLAAADLNADGKVDILLGTNHPSIMKGGFGTNPTDKNSTAGRIYWSQNISTSDQVIFKEPQMLTSSGKPIECFGNVYPSTNDFDGDGLIDLILGDHKPGTRLFRNIGKNNLPDFDPLGNLEDIYEQNVASIIYTQWDKADLNGDKQVDFVTCSPYFSPNLFHWLPKINNSNMWAKPVVVPVETTQSSPLIGPGISTPVPVDFNEDGKIDLLLGSEPGVPMVAINIGSNNKKIFAPPVRLKWLDGTPIEVYSSEIGDGSHHGPLEWFDDRVTPRLADWDNDGIDDIISGTQGRRLYWLKGNKIDGELRFEKPKIFKLDGNPMLHPHRSLPAVVDWNDDGYLDIIAFLETGYIAVFIGNGTDEFKESHPLLTVSDEPVSPSTVIIEPNINTTLSGRCGVDVADWNMDGLIDLVTCKASTDGSVHLHLQTSSGCFEQPIKLLHWEGHLGGPSVIDWDGDGYLDILLGGDYKRLCGNMFGLPTTKRAHYYFVHSQSLAVPSMKR